MNSQKRARTILHDIEQSASSTSSTSSTRSTTSPLLWLPLVLQSSIFKLLELKDIIELIYVSKSSQWMIRNYLRQCTELYLKGDSLQSVNDCKTVATNRVMLSLPRNLRLIEIHTSDMSSIVKNCIIDSLVALIKTNQLTLHTVNFPIVTVDMADSITFQQDFEKLLRALPQCSALKTINFLLRLNALPCFETSV
jgi:hypothetical protein